MPKTAFVRPDAVRARLRVATNAAHVRLHTHPEFAGLMAGKLSRMGYADLLARLLGLHAPLEARLALWDDNPLMAWRTLANTPSRPSRLCADLAFLHADVTAVPSAASITGLLPNIESPAAALGCAWVVEGSSLGGVVLGRKLGTILGLADAAQGGAFFAPHPEQAARWRGCCAAVELCGSDPRRYAALQAASIATFGAFEAWLGRRWPLRGCAALSA